MVLGKVTATTYSLPCSDEDQGDPISAPPGPYTIQPHVRGKLLWLTGPPGLGKSTTAQLLAREKGFNQLISLFPFLFLLQLSTVDIVAGIMY